MKLLFVLLLLSGCTPKDIASLTGYDKMCIDGISYIQFGSGAHVQVDEFGKPVKCGKKPTASNDGT